MIKNFVKVRVAVFINTAKLRTASQHLLLIYLTSMRGVYQLNRGLVDKTKGNSPVARDSERQQSDKRLGEMSGMKQWIVGIDSQALQKQRQFILLCHRELADASNESGMVNKFNHYGDSSLLLETPFCSQNAAWGGAVRHSALFARIQGDILPRHLSRRCLQQTSEAFLSPLRAQACSYISSVSNRSLLSIVTFLLILPLGARASVTISQSNTIALTQGLVGHGTFDGKDTNWAMVQCNAFDTSIEVK